MDEKLEVFVARVEGNLYWRDNQRPSREVIEELYRKGLSVKEACDILDRT